MLTIYLMIFLCFLFLLSLQSCDAVSCLSAYRIAQFVVKFLSPQTTRLNLPKTRVICAGFDRAMMSQALTELGYSVYDFWSFLDTRSAWEDFLTDHQNTTRLIESIDGYNAIVDFPGCLLYKDYMALYPDAKVVLAAPQPQSRRWANETLSTVFRMVQLSHRQPFQSFGLFQSVQNVFEKWVFRVIGVPVVKANKGKSLVLPSQDALIQSYHEWVEEVKSNVPKDRLLVMADISWRHLCDFLSPTSPIIQNRCRDLFHQQFPKNSPRFLWMVAAIQFVAECFDQLPLAVLVLVGVVNAIVIIFTRKTLKAKEKTE